MLAAVLTLAFGAASAVAQVCPFQGCINFVPKVSTYQYPATSRSQCNAVCYGYQTLWSLWKPTTSECWCSNMVPVWTWSDAMDSKGHCALDMYHVSNCWRKQTTALNFQGCYDNVFMYPAPYTGTELPSVGFNSFGAYEINVGLVTYNYVCLIQCLNQNKPYTYATYLNTTVNTYSGNKRCVCSQDVSLGNPTVCTQNSFYVYTRNAVADDPNMSESVMRRRRLLQEMKAAEAAANPYCPRGFEACRTTAGGYECIDTSEELESCGGCVHGSFEDDKASGVDCTLLPGIEEFAVSCNQGRCVAASCEDGYQLANGTCVPV